MTISRANLRLVLPAGALLGGAWTLSPMTVVSLLALALIVMAGVRGLGGRERRVVRTVVLVSIAVRLLAILALFLYASPGHVETFPFEGDAWLLKLRALWIRNLWLGTPIDPFFFTATFDPYGWTGYIYLIAFLQYVFSPAPYAIHLINLTCSIAAILVLHRLVRWGYGATAGLIALVVLLLLPTQFMWSISALKEPLYVSLLVAIVAAAAVAGAGSGAWRRILALAGVLVAAMAVNSVRSGALAIVVLALAIAAGGTFVVRRPYVLLLALLFAPFAAAVALRVPAVNQRVMAQLRTSAALHIGHVRTLGHGYKALDQRFYTFNAGDPTNPFDAMTGAEAVRFAARSFASFWIVPTPGQVASRSELLFLLQQLLWYGLLLLAAVGMVEGSVRHAWLTGLLAGLSLSGSLAIALNSGNIGTLVRHRDGIVPFVVCLSAIGASALLGRAGAFRREAFHAPPARAGAAVPSFPRRVAAGSVAVGTAMRLVRGSLLCSAVAAVLHPVFGYRTPPPDAADRVDDVLARVSGSSRVVALGRRACAPVAAAWRHAVMRSVVEGVEGQPLADRIRLIGQSLAVGVLVSGMLAPFADHAWPALFPWIASLVCAAVLVSAARPLALAWQRRPQS